MLPSKVINLFQFFILPLIFLQSSTVSTSPHKIPILSPHNTLFRNHNYKLSRESSSSDDFKTYYYKQTLDHFNYAPQSYATFRQRFVVNYKHWGGRNSRSPIFAYFGAEEAIDVDLETIGFTTDNAPYFKSLSVFIEHRFYGKSIPFGMTMEKAIKNSTIRGYFNSAQAVADYAQILLHLKHKLSAHKSPIIVVGGSYGGMLASWFRLKYPHIALGALASSAPVLYLDNITPQNGYYSIVTKDFKEVSHSCFETIRKSWAHIDRVASLPGGLSILSHKFRTCWQLGSSEELKDYLVSIYSVAAQYNHPPSNPGVELVCEGIDEAKKMKLDIIERIFAGILSYNNSISCIQTIPYPSEITIGWEWQTCSEIVVPIGNGKKDTMFQNSPFNLRQYSEYCHHTFGVPPRPHWLTTYFGGHDIKLVLKRFGSNIIFSNGLKDPYSSGGVLESISKSIVAVNTLNGSHCLDILKESKSDPKWLVMQRRREIKIIEGWLATYYADLVLD